MKMLQPDLSLQLSPGMRLPYWIPAVVVSLLLLLASRFSQSLAAWPEIMTFPLGRYVTQGVNWVARDISVYGVTVRDVTRLVAAGISAPLGLLEGLLYRGFRPYSIPPLPWAFVAIAVAVIGHKLGGRALALLGGSSVLYLAVFGLWEDAMRTFSLILMAVPSSAFFGLMLGIAMFGNKRVERGASVVMDAMQATPHLAYLAPIAVFFGFGPVPAMIASSIFAFPPMARCALLGMRGVPESAIEAARVAGCREWQLLWRVRVPSSLPEILVGLNQVVMQTLAMTVISALVGATGLGHRLLVALQQLQIGRALESGVAIVIIAITLDRLTRAWARKAADYHVKPTNLFVRHGHLLIVMCALIVAVTLAQFFPAVQVLPRTMTVTTAPVWDTFVRWLSITLANPLGEFRDLATIYVLIPVRKAFVAAPWPATLFLLGWLSYRMGGLNFALPNIAMVAVVGVAGLWVPAMLTLYLTTISVIICIVIGVPIGVAAAHSPRLARGVLAICDTLQTFPSFIYLIPVVMLFRVGDLASIIAIIGYATVPIVRLTYLGISGVSPTIIEAAISSGTTRRQRFRYVELPLAMPAILLGLNQTILMALAMTSITALIGSRDLGQEILKALPEVDTGRGLLAGLSIAIIGIVANRVIGLAAGKMRSVTGRETRTA
ncbi:MULTISPECIES: proline/glycine betaine ABC transporter permease [unclassified Rhizobium]|jgi:glycine betaine/proline transport system permease protein|uniref:ABC transporter permease n=1 Tax=Hyphomicrobiales TaxID=356 RepID=UPI000689273A|nr:ABC transporter permease subunit [Rhizobium sp. WW_1]RKD74052.1 glycine betaine/proline transport system permease protein [Rhizobium sp. WW_1]